MLGDASVKQAQINALQQKQSVVGSYVQELTAVNDALSTGQIDASAAGTRTRAISNKYAAGYSQYTTDFKKANEALSGITELGEAQKQVDMSTALRQQDKTQASQLGYTFYPGMSKQAEDAQIASAKQSIAGQIKLEAQYKANAEQRSAGSDQRTQNDYIEKHNAVSVLQDIGASNITSFQAFTADLADKVKSGKMQPDTASQLLNERYSNISAGLTSAAGIDPAVGSAWQKTFDNLNEYAKTAIDPKTAANFSADAFNAALNKMKLYAFQSSPNARAAITLDKLFSNNPTVGLTISGTASGLMSQLSQVPLTQTGTTNATQYTPQIVGNPEVESDSLKLLKNAVGELQKGKLDPKDKQIAITQATNSNNQILKQTSALLDQGASPQQLKGLANYFASPEYASMVTGGTISKDAAGAAKKTFQLLYEPTIINGVQQKLNNTLQQQSGDFETKGVPMSQSVDIKFTGSGIVFENKPVEGLDMASRMYRGQNLKTLDSSVTAINQLIHMGAHLEGSTDYGKYWEENKHIILPSIFPDPVKLKPGQVVNGYEYTGGNYSDRSNWRPAGK